MLPTNRVATHPGVLLKELFLDEMNLTQTALAAHTGMSMQRVNELITGKRGVTAETAWLLAQALGTSPEFWMNAQAAHDLTKHRPTHKLHAIKPSMAPAIEAVGKLADETLQALLSGPSKKRRIFKYSSRGGPTPGPAPTSKQPKRPVKERRPS